MYVLLVGGDTRLLDQIETHLSKPQNFVQLYKMVALNHAIEQTQITAFDLIINTMQIPFEDGVQLSEIFRTSPMNTTVPTISLSSNQDCEQLMYSPSSSELNYFVTGIEELTYLAGEIINPDKGRSAA